MDQWIYDRVANNFLDHWAIILTFGFTQSIKNLCFHFLLNYGNLNVIFGTDNKVGNTDVTTSSSSVNYIAQKSFIHGNENEIDAPFGTPVQHVFIAGKKNRLDLQYVCVSMRITLI